MGDKSDSASNKGGFLGIFFMAFTLALVSFSCTGPIVGTLLVESATIEVLVHLSECLVFLSHWLFHLPYLLLSWMVKFFTKVWWMVKYS